MSNARAARGEEKKEGKGGQYVFHSSRAKTCVIAIYLLCEPGESRQAYAGNKDKSRGEVLDVKNKRVYFIYTRCRATRL